MLNSLKKMSLGRLAKILSIMAISSSILLGLVVWIFDVPSYFNGDQNYHFDSSGNSITIDESKIFKDIKNLTTLEIDLRFTDVTINTSENDSDEISLICKGLIKSNSEIKKPFLKFDNSSDYIKISSDTRGGFRLIRSTVELEITIPKDKLNELSINTGSSNVHIAGDITDNLMVDTSSGNITISDFNGKIFHTESSSGDQRYKNIITENLKISSSSGVVVLTKSNSKEASIETSSGDIDIMKFSTKENRIDTTSGSITIENFSGNLNCSSSSGSITANFEEKSDEIIIGTISGDVKLILPKESGFKLRTDTNSGDFDSSFTLKLNGGYGKKYIDATIGDGEGKVKIHTSSGDITVNSK